MLRKKKVFVNPLTNPRHYNVALPNRFGAWLLWVLGPTVIGIGLVSIAISLVWYNRAYEPDFRGPLEWGAWVFYAQLALILLGAALSLMPFARIYPHFYRDLYRNVRVVRRETRGGGLTGGYHVLIVEGVTRANTIRRAAWPVSAGDWHDIKSGARFMGS